MSKGYSSKTIDNLTLIAYKVEDIDPFDHRLIGSILDETLYMLWRNTKPNYFKIISNRSFLMVQIKL